MGVALNRKGNACRQKGTSSLVSLVQLCSLIDGLRPKVHSLCHGAHQAIMLFPFMILYDLPHLGNGTFLDLSRVGFKSSCVLLRFASAVVSMYTACTTGLYENHSSHPHYLAFAKGGPCLTMQRFIICIHSFFLGGGEEGGVEMVIGWIW